MRILKPLFLGGLCLSLALPALADNESSASLSPVPKSFQYCTVCHGVGLRGNPSTGAPRLSGLPTWYIEKQLTSFKSLWRGTVEQDYPGNEMRVAAEGITSEQIPAAATYASNTQSPVATASITGDIKAGQALFTATCASCHGADAQGDQSKGAPPLVGRNDWYLERQMKNFMTGRRGIEPKDERGQQMAVAVKVLSDDKAIDDVVAYIDSLKSQ